MFRILLIIPLLFLACQREVLAQTILDEEDELNLQCLRESYPQIKGIDLDENGKKWLTFSDGDAILYEGAGDGQGLDSDVKTSMSQTYPLEPGRPDTPLGVAPGRKRSYDFFKKIYGSSEAEVKKNLAGVKFLGKTIKLSPGAASAFAEAAPGLEALAAENREFAKLLKPEGGYYWRKIAGETNLSAHSYGIALDVGVDHSPYWRWSSKMPHPLQKTWPGEIVRLMEEQGFIWGGKWHEYDLMHFEYRPELVCKARKMAAKNQADTAGSK